MNDEDERFQNPDEDIPANANIMSNSILAQKIPEPALDVVEESGSSSDSDDMGLGKPKPMPTIVSSELPVVQ